MLGDVECWKQNFSSAYSQSLFPDYNDLPGQRSKGFFQGFYVECWDLGCVLKFWGPQDLSSLCYTYIYIYIQIDISESKYWVYVCLCCMFFGWFYYWDMPFRRLLSNVWESGHNVQSCHIWSCLKTTLLQKYHSKKISDKYVYRIIPIIATGLTPDMIFFVVANIIAAASEVYS